MTIIFKEKELESVGEVSKVSSQIILKYLFLTRIGRSDIQWSANKLVRSITKWTKACETMSRLIFYIHHTCDNKQQSKCETLQKNKDWDCFKTSILQEILRIQNLHQVEHCAFFGSHTFVPISWMCRKQTSVSHSSTESDTISLDAALRLDGISAPDL